MILNTSSAPLYEQVLHLLRKEVRSTYKIGDSLPSQGELSKRFNTSLITIKRAIKELENEGMLECRSGKRALVVRKSIVDGRHGVSSWTDTIFGIGEVPQTKWVKFSLDEPTEREAQLLGLRVGQKITTVKRLRMIEGEPICLMENKIPEYLAPGLNETNYQNESLYEHLKAEHNLVPVHADEEISARMATPAERKALAMKSRIVMVINRRTFSKNQTPMELATVTAVAENYTYKTIIK